MPAKCCQCGMVAPDKRLMHPYYPGPGGPPDLYCPACWKKRTDRTEALEAKFTIGLVVAIVLVGALLPAEHGGALGRLAASIIVIELLGVALHELGHAVAARLLGMKVFKFSVGIGRTLFTRRIGETEVEFKLLPFSGYVLPGDQSLSFSRMRHIAVSAAGPLTNVALAAVGFAAIGAGWTQPPRGIESITFWHLFAGINALIAALTLMPVKVPTGVVAGRFSPTDGLQIIAALLMRGRVFRHWLAHSVRYQAQERINRGDPGGAVRLAQDAAARFAQAPELRLVFAAMLAQVGRYREAEAVLDELRRGGDLEWDVAALADLTQAKVLLDGGDPQRIAEADRLSDQAYRVWPDDETVRLVRGRALVASGWVDKGEQMLRPLLDTEASPKSTAECACALAEAALAAGDRAAAEHYVTLARSLDERCPELERIERRVRGR